MGHWKKPHGSTFELLWKIFFDHKHSRKALSIAFLFSALCIVLNFTIPAILKFIVDSLVTGGISSSGQQKLIIGSIILYSVAWNLAENINSLAKILIYKIVTNSISTYSTKFFAHIMSLPATFHSAIKTGSIIESIFRTQEALDNLYWEVIFYIYPTFAEIILATIIIWNAYNWIFSLIFFSIVFSYIVISYFAANAITKNQILLNQKRMEVASKTIDSLSNWQTVYIFGNSKLESQRIGQCFTAQATALYNFILRDYLVLILKETFFGIGLLIITLVTGIGVIKGILTVGDFTMANAYFLKLSVPLRNLGTSLKDIRRYLNDLYDTEKILKIETSVQSLKALSCQEPPSIEFKNVSFSYPSNPQIHELELLHPQRSYAIKEVSFKLKKGEVLAIVGHSGSGKSTIAKLICKLYAPNKGAIFIEDQPISDLDEQSIRNSIAVVSQDFEMFEQSIRYNLLYSKPEATEQELESAIEKANLSHFVSKLPNGLDTHLGKKGVSISGGERQRIAIARAILRNPSIFIFDEPTSALDVLTQEKVNQTIKEISSRATTIIIAHKFTTIANANRIIILDEGKVVANGTHEDLIKENRFYQKMFLFAQT